MPDDFGLLKKKWRGRYTDCKKYYGRNSHYGEE